MNWKRVAVVVAVLLAAYVAIQGGEYSTTDLLRQRTRQHALNGTVDSLRHQVDSLNALKRRLSSDPALQERIAREAHGMVRGDKELVYRFTDPRATAR